MKNNDLEVTLKNDKLEKERQKALFEMNLLDNEIRRKKKKTFITIVFITLLMILLNM